MAVYRALTVQGGQTKQIQDANFLAVGGGLDRPTSGTLTIGEQNSATITIGSHANTTAINIGTQNSVKTITIGSGITGGVDATTLILDGNVQVTGTETVDGGTTFNDNVTFGNATTDWVAFVARVGPVANPNIYFVAENDHSISIDASTTTGTAGGALTVRSAAGSPADVANPGGAGGAYSASAGTGGVADGNNDGGAGGGGTISAGAGGAGTLTNLAGIGGNLSVLGGAAGKANGAGSTLGNDGGSVTVRGGEGKGTGQIGGAAYLDGGPCALGTGGAVAIGDTSAPTVTIGRNAGTSVTLNSGAIYLQEAGTTRMTIDGGYIQPNCDVVFTNTTKRALYIAPSAVTAPGQEMTFQSGAGGNSDSGSAAGAGGLAKYLSNNGGNAGAAAGETSAAGGDIQVTAGSGGIGEPTQPNNPSNGGNVYVMGGASGAKNGCAVGATGGSATIDAGAGDVTGSYVYIGNTNANNVALGNNTSIDTYNGASHTFKEAGTTLMTLDGGLIQPNCNVVFTNGASRVIGIAQTAVTVTGKTLTIGAGSGGNASGGNNAGDGGPFGAFGGNGGDATANANEGAAPGGLAQLQGGTGGAGDNTQPNLPGSGGDVTVQGGYAGSSNGTNGADGGSVTISGGVESANGATGGVTITTPAPSGTGAAGTITIKTSNTNRLIFATAPTPTITVQAGTKLKTTGTGTISLPVNGLDGSTVFFEIGGAAVTSAAITAANFDMLFDGSVVTTHTHSGLSGSSLDVAGLDTTTKSVGTGLFGYQDSTASEMDLTDADAPAKSFCFGANIGTAGSMRIAGVVAAAKFNTADGAPSNGAPVFLSPATKDAGTAAGKLTSVAPTTVGQSVAQVGICMDNSAWAASKTCKVLLQVTTKIDL